MKRSEMLDILSNSIYEHISAYPDGTLDTDDYRYILDDLEKAGMLPPISEEDIKEINNKIDRHNSANPTIYDAYCILDYCSWDTKDTILTLGDVFTVEMLRREANRNRFNEERKKEIVEQLTVILKKLEPEDE